MLGTPPNEATLHDVARLAGVHLSTVSRALSPDKAGLVAKATAERVRAAAEQLGYRPNAMARGLKTGRSSAIGLLVPDITNPLFPPMVRVIESVLKDAGYMLLTVNCDDGVERQNVALSTLLDRKVDGIIAATERRTSNEIADRTRTSGLPVVSLMQRSDAESLPSVCPDERSVMSLAVNHLVELGHTKIGHVAGPQDNWNAHERRYWFEAAMRRHDLEVDPNLTATADRLTIESGAMAMQQMLDAGGDFTAIVGCNDLITLGAQDVLAQSGRRCPDDVSLIGINDMPLSDRLCPALTTVNLSQQEMGRRAATMLLERLSDPTAPVRHEHLKPQLKVRASTRPV